MKILLCCNAGMSSSILVKKIQDAAAKNGEDIEVKAVANSAVKNEVGKWDVCLVGPQLMFAVNSIKTQLNIPVGAIEPRTYAMADGDAAIKFAKKLLG
ncbi:MAG: PTS sugar transporter subunit IIB [Floccifex sp.]